MNTTAATQTPGHLHPGDAPSTDRFSTPRAARFVLGIFGQVPLSDHREAATWSNSLWECRTALAANRTLLPLVRHICRATGIVPPHGVARTLKLQTAAQAIRSELLMREQESALSILHRHALPVAVFKGSSLATMLYPCPELRPQLDIDLVVNPTRFEEAAALLLHAGWRRGRAQSLHELFTRNGMVIELHRALFGTGESVLFNYAETDTQRFVHGSFSAEETTLLVMLKLFSETIFSPVKLCDVFALLADPGLDTTALTRETRCRDAAFAAAVLGGVIARFDNEYAGTASPLWGGVALNRQLLWSRLKYARVLLGAHQRLRKLLRILCDHRSYSDPARSSAGKRLRSMLSTFFGLRYRTRY